MSILNEIALEFPLLWEEWPVGPIVIRRGQFKLSVIRPIKVTYLGFDPGEVNMGMAYFNPKGEGELWQVKFPSNCDSVKRIYNTESVMNFFLMGLKDKLGSYSIVENASFGSPFGQAALAENRTIIAHNLIEQGLDLAFIPPLSIRKHVFGSGKIKAEDTWPELAYKGHNDIASALACALCGYEMRL